jgi:hypothetical protein
MKKMIICPICGEKLEQKSDLKRHIEKAHPDDTLSDADFPMIEKPMPAAYPKDNYESNISEEETVKDEEYVKPAKILSEYSNFETKEYGGGKIYQGDEKIYTDESSPISEVDIFDGIAYPANPEQLIRNAEIKGDEEMAKRVRDLPIKEYADATEIAKALRISEKKKSDNLSKERY